MGVKIYVRDASLNRVGGEVDNWDLLETDRMWGGVGAWKLTLPADHPRVDHLLTPKAGIVVEIDGEYLTSGSRAWAKTTYQDKKFSLELSGFDDTVQLARRRTDPCPRTTGSSTPLWNGTATQVGYTSGAYDVQGGKAESVIKYYVDANLGAGAVAGRQLPRFVIDTDRARGNQVGESVRFDMLNQIVAKLAIAGGNLGWGIEQVGQLLHFDVRLPGTVPTMQFSTSAGTLTGFTYERSAPITNSTLVAGQGEGTARVFVLGTNQESIDEWGLIEDELRDRRDTDSLGVMQSTADEELAKGADQLSISFTASDSEARQWRRDWDIGDLATTIVNGVTYTELIRSVKTTWASGAAMKVEPTIGGPDARPPDVLGIFARQRTLARRTANLERR